MKQYKDFRPSANDVKGLGLKDRQKWFVVSVSQTRDSNCLDISNFRTAEKLIAAVDPDGESYEKHRFSHWGPGWFEIIIVKENTKAFEEAEKIESSLDNYSILNENDYQDLLFETSCDVWEKMRSKDRIEYIKENRNEFEFQSFRYLLGCARGKFFSGDAANLLEE